MRLSKAFFQTYREVPKDADVISQQLMARGNFIRKHAAGIYSYLPMMVRSYHKLCKILREELDAISWQEVVMPYAVPGELWKESGRWDVMGDLMAKFKDRKDNDFCLGPTHEEVVTDLVRSQVNSYKQLPVTLYQITPKFRDEFRPRFGLMRGREFVMMDGYSFHASKADLDRHYEEIAGAYERVFQRSGLRFARVEADTGAMGGAGSHEYQVLASSGEDAILNCESCGYAANVEKAETPLPELQKRDWGTLNPIAPKEISTPTQKTIEAVSGLTGIPTHRNVKTLVYRFNVQDAEGKAAKAWTAVVVYMLGHRQLNEVKLSAALGRAGITAMNMGAMPEPEVQKLFNAPVGFLGPIGGPTQIKVFFDREIKAAHDVVCGANQEGLHLGQVEPSRDFTDMNVSNTVDIVNAVQGDICPRCKTGQYQEHRGIEVGHIFKLGDKYTKAMKAAFQDDQKGSQTMEMGCYGIGVTRVIAACLEQNHDADGMIWPEALAPYQVQLVNLGPNDAEVTAVAESFYKELLAQKIEVLFDDRDLSPGVKFKDADLIGTPRRLVIGKKGLEAGELEFSLRKDKAKKMLAFKNRDAESLRAVISQILA